MTTRFPRLAVAAALTNAFVWGVSWLPLRWLEERGVATLWVTCFIFATCAVAVAITRPSCVAQFFSVPKLLWLTTAAGLTNVFFNAALVMGDVVRAVLLFYLMPVWVVVLARVLLGERISTAALVRVGLGLIGAALVLGKGELALPMPRSLPDWLAVGGGFMFGLNNVLLRKFADTPDEARAFAIFIGGAVLPPLAIAMLAAFGVVTAAPLLSTQVIVGLAGFAVAVLVANLALQYAAPKLTANTLSLIMISEVLFATISSAIWGDAILSPAILLGGALIVSASLLAVFQKH